jgi:lysophospholipase L1-like esterase
VRQAMGPSRHFTAYLRSRSSFADMVSPPVHSAVRRWALQGGLVVVSIAAAGLLGEGLSRVVLNRVDYLAVDPVPDTVLGVRLPPHAAGHDEWGFRNRGVPDRADVVTIGDSQTYGISAPARLSWPAQLAELIRRPVYNLALGGYGPVQYDELLRTRALRLRPAVIVVGFYYGNDLWDAYTAVYGLRHWAAMRQHGIPEVSDSAQVSQQRDVLLAPVRDWLARHSVVYRLASFTVLGGYARAFEFTMRDHASDVIPFQLPVHGASTGFTPLLRLKVVNLQDAAVREGLRLSLDRLESMADECRAAGVHFLVALIPTKERVYAPWLGNRSNLPAHDTFRALLRNEYEANRQVQKQLDRLGVRYVDLEMPLREAAAFKTIYPASEDGHPNSEGYSVIAHAVATAVRDWLP